MSSDKQQSSRSTVPWYY